MNKITKLLLGITAGACFALLGDADTVQAADSVNTNAMYRLYNKNSGEHFYTKNTNEVHTLQKAGWNYEGVGWYAPSQSSTPVYRLYNKNAGDHHYTTSAAEKNNLVKVGWIYEGIGWYSSDAKAVGLHRSYNPNAKAGAHHYTTSSYEHSTLCKAGWRNEGTGWYGVSQSKVVNYDEMVKQGAPVDWTKQIITWAVPISKEHNLYPSIMVAQAILESGWGKSGLAIEANNLFGIKKGTNNWTGALVLKATAEATTADNQTVTGFKTEADARDASKQAEKLTFPKKGTYYYVRAEFRKYASQYDSLKDNGNFLEQPRYVNVHRNKSLNYKEAAQALKDAGYATSPTYPEKLIRLIEQYNLQALD
jgi:predicted nucleic acid-binding Zn ribbon protein